MDQFEGLLDDFDTILTKGEHLRLKLAESELVSDFDEIQDLILKTRNKVQYRERLGSGLVFIQ